MDTWHECNLLTDSFTGTYHFPPVNSICKSPFWLYGQENRHMFRNISSVRNPNGFEKQVVGNPYPMEILGKKNRDTRGSI